jgi:hypothetical protein
MMSRFRHNIFIGIAIALGALALVQAVMLVNNANDRERELAQEAVDRQ